MAERIAPLFLFRFRVFNPKHFIVAVVSDEAWAQQAAAALRDAGFSPVDLHLVPGRDILSSAL